VHILGFSLGGVLALILAADHDIESLVLLAPAVTNTNRLIVLTPLLRRFITKLPTEVDFQGQDPENPELRYLAEEYWRWKWAAPAAELFKLQRRSKSAAKKIRAKTMLMVSEADTTVPADVKELLAKRLGQNLARTVVLKKSEHTLTTDIEKEKVVDEVLSWFRMFSGRRTRPV
jgi:carboxylesterase